MNGSIRKAPCGGEGTGKSHVDRAKLGWKWSVAVDAAGIPIGWAIDGAYRNDIKLLAPTLEAIAATNTWRSNYGQLRRNTDRRSRHRHAALRLATTVIIIGKLIDYRNRWSPK